MTSCYYHPEKPGIGICVRCHEILCANCITRMGGVNHCHACLVELANRPVPVEAASIPLQILVLLVAFTGLCGVIWMAGGSLAP